MFEEYESRGKTVDEAIFRGLNELGISIDEVEVKIVQTESRGVFGLGAKPAIVILKKRPLGSEQYEEDETPIPQSNGDAPNDEKMEESPVQPQQPQRSEHEGYRPRPAHYEQERNYEPQPQRERRTDYEQPYQRPHNPYQQNGYNRAYQPRYHEQEYHRNYDETDARTRMKIVDVPTEEYSEAAVERCDAALFIKELLKRMEINAKVTAVVEEGRHFVNISSEDSAARIIGKRGETLSAIQYIAALVVNREKDGEHVKVTVDSDGYCQRHYEQLVRAARAKANIVRSTGRDFRFEPMTAYDRRIIHFALQRNPAVFTHSEGEEPNRYLIISPKNRRRRY